LVDIDKIKELKNGLWKRDYTIIYIQEKW
jgi:hypothetical protein